jgi:hypothetical protein
MPAIFDKRERSDISLCNGTVEGIRSGEEETPTGLQAGCDVCE